MRAGVGFSGAVVSRLGGDGGRTPPAMIPKGNKISFTLLN